MADTAQALAEAKAYVQENLVEVTRDTLGLNENKKHLDHVHALLREGGMPSHIVVGGSLISSAALSRVAQFGEVQLPTPEEIRNAWDAQADEFNKWPELDEDEKLTWAAKVTQAAYTGIYTAGKKEALVNAGYIVGLRDASVQPGVPGKYMVVDKHDEDGFAIVGDDLNELVVEAYDAVIAVC